MAAIGMFSNVICSLVNTNASEILDNIRAVIVSEKMVTLACDIGWGKLVRLSISVMLNIVSRQRNPLACACSSHTVCVCLCAILIYSAM